MADKLKQVPGICGPFNNTATADGFFKANEGEHFREISAAASYVVQCVNTFLTKDCDKAYALVGDTIHYTITVTNNSSVEMFGVKVFDTISPMTTLVPGSIVPAPGPGETLATGVTIGDALPGASLTLQFDATVNDGAAGELINSAYATCIYYGSGEYVYTTNTDNAITLTVEACLEITKTANTEFVFGCGDEVEFTLVVHNCGTLQINDIVVTDTLPDGLIYKKHSTYKNTVGPTNEDPGKGIVIGNLKPDESYTIVFTAIVNCD